jgi:6-phosphofructokinase 1
MSGANGCLRVGILTGGGDCPGLNAVIRAVAKTLLLEAKAEIIGVHDGFAGLIEQRVCELNFDAVSNILTRGGTILGSSNTANPFQVPTVEHGKLSKKDCSERTVAYARNELRLDGIVAIGGDGTMSICGGLIEKGLPVVGVPKTIDNDLLHTDITFGFDTAVTTASEAIDKIHTTAQSHHRVMIVEVMGRYAGWIALHAGASTGTDVILIPEIPYSYDAIWDLIEFRRRKGRSFTIICIAEGAKPLGGQMTVASVVSDSPDPIRLGGAGTVLARELHERFGIECRATILGHVQRGGTPTPFDRNLATLFGHQAACLVKEGRWGRMATFAKGRIDSVEIEKVANKTKTVSLEDRLLVAARAVGVHFGQP